MIRTAAALFAKKTAVVAITGAVVLGGATLALAEIGQPPVDGACGTGEVLNEQTQLCEADPDAPAPEEPCTDNLETPDVDECAPEEEPCTDNLETPDVDECAPEEEPCTDNLETPDVDECAPEEEPCTDKLETPDVDECAPEEEPCTDNLETPDVDECADPVTEGDGEEEGDGDDLSTHPENHGKYVSEAAKGGGDCTGLTGRDKGQCVATVAKSELGKKGAEPATEEEPVADQPQEPVIEEQEQELEAAEAPAPAKAPGKPDHAGSKAKGPKK